MADAGSPKSPEQPELLNQKQAMALLGVRSSKWYEMKAAGLLPPPVNLPGKPMYRRRDLLRWVEKLPVNKRG